MTVPVPNLEERLAHLLQQIGEPGLCKGCAQRIRWVVHLNRKKTPYDAEGPTIGVNHFITCPRRGDFKR